MVKKPGFVSSVGDDAINEIKLKNYLKADAVPATDNDLTQNGLVKGFIGPVQIDGLRVVFDDQINKESNYVIGGNGIGFTKKIFY